MGVCMLECARIATQTLHLTVLVQLPAVQLVYGGKQTFISKLRKMGPSGDVKVDQVRPWHAWGAR